MFKSLSEIKKPILSDQDILNCVCYGHVYFLATRWNIEWQIRLEFNDWKNRLYSEYCNAYELALQDPAIIHFASPRKPWVAEYRNEKLAWYWWKYARLSPYYEDLLNQIMDRLHVPVYNNTKTDRLFGVIKTTICGEYKKYKFLGLTIYKIKFCPDVNKHYLFGIQYKMEHK